MQSNTTYKTHEPEHGYTKEIRKYAWLPTFVNDRWVWLERYYMLVLYERVSYVVKIDGRDMEFKVGRWVVLSKKTK